MISYLFLLEFSALRREENWSRECVVCLVCIQTISIQLKQIIRSQHKLYTFSSYSFPLFSLKFTSSFRWLLFFFFFHFLSLFFLFFFFSFFFRMHLLHTSFLIVFTCASASVVQRHLLLIVRVKINIVLSAELQLRPFTKPINHHSKHNQTTTDDSSIAPIDRLVIFLLLFHIDFCWIIRWLDQHNSVDSTEVSYPSSYLLSSPFLCFSCIFSFRVHCVSKYTPESCLFFNCLLFIFLSFFFLRLVRLFSSIKQLDLSWLFRASKVFLFMHLSVCLLSLLLVLFQFIPLL